MVLSVLKNITCFCRNRANFIVKVSGFYNKKYICRVDSNETENECDLNFQLSEEFGFQ